MPAVARALTALGVRVDTAGERHGLLSQIVPDGATITELAAIIVRSGAAAQELHQDTKAHLGDASMTTAFIVLQDTSADLGALAVVPGSQSTQMRGPPTDCGDTPYHPRAQATAPAGTVTLMDSHLLHRGGAHTASGPLTAGGGVGE